MNKIKVLIGAGFLVGLVAVSVVFLRDSDVQKNSGVQWVSVDGSNLTDSEKRFVDNAKRAEKESSEKIKKTLIDGFTLSAQRNAPDVGDRFPNEKIIDPKYQSISFKNKITTIIIGQGTAEGPEQIAEQFKPYIQNKSLNLIRIVTSGSLPTNSLATAVIDARNPEDTRYANTSSGKVANWLSLPRSPVAYLIDQNGIIVYSKFSGGYTDLEELPKYLKSYLVEKIKLTAQRKTLKLNQRVDLANLDFVPKAILEKYLNPKSGTTVLIFTQPECNACEGIKGGINEGIKRWQGGGNGVILINADPAIANGYDEKTVH